MADHPTDKTDIRTGLREFSYYFLLAFIEQLTFYRDILEENPNAAKKPSSLPITITSSLVSAIPTFGKPIGVGLQQGEKMVVAKLDKKNACTLAEIAYYSRDEKDALKNTIIEAIFQLFCSFEKQFTQVNCKGGRTRAMQKLAVDASHRLVTYLLENPATELTPEIIVKGVLYGESKRHKLGVIKSGRTLILQNTDDKVTTSALYTKIGVCIKKGDEYKFFKNKDTNTELLGHRVLFTWEDENHYENWVDDDATIYDYKLNPADWKAETESVRKYIAKTDPFEDLKESHRIQFEEQVEFLERASVERMQIRDELLENFDQSHDSTVKSIKDSQSYVVKAITDNQQIILEHVDEKYKQIQQNVSGKHEELVEVISETKMAVNTTEEKINRYNDDIAILKNKAKKDEGEIHLKINRNDVKKVEESLKKIDGSIKNFTEKIEKNDVKKLEKVITESGEFKKWKKKLRKF